MAFTSIGYDGSVNERQWAELVPSVGSSIYGVKGAGDLKVTAVPGQPLMVSVAAGTAWGHGVMDTETANTTITCSPISSGNRWDLIAVRRDWQPLAGGPTAIAKVTGASQKVIPTSRKQSPGVWDDQPLALVQWTAGQTQPTAIVDLRCWASNGGLVANDVLVKTYLDTPGTRVSILGVDWLRRLGANDMPEWIKVNSLNLNNGASTNPTLYADIASVSSDANGAAAIVFPESFPRRILGAVATQVKTPNVGSVQLHYDEGLSNEKRAAFFVYNASGTGLVPNLINLRISYIAWGD